MLGVAFTAAASASSSCTFRTPSAANGYRNAWRRIVRNPSTVAGFWTGDQVTVRAGLGLLTGPESEERERSAATVSAWLAALTAAGLVPPDGPRGIAEFTVGLYGYLARTPALLVGVSLADAVGDTRSQNIPGTVDQYPNWRIPLCDEIGQPVLIEDLPGHPLVRAVVRAVSGVSKAA